MLIIKAKAIFIMAQSMSTMNKAAPDNNCRFFKSRQLLFCIKLISFCIPCFLLFSCVALHGRDGKKWYYRKPIVIGRGTGVDTNVVIVLPFNLEAYKNGHRQQGNKRIVMALKPDDLKFLARERSIDYVHLYLPGCSGSALEVRHFDSLVRAGRRVMVVALSLSAKSNQRMLANTTFANYPELYLDGQGLPKPDMLRKIEFIRSACPACYQLYKDEVIDAYCLSLRDDTIKVIMYHEMSGL